MRTAKPQFLLAIILLAVFTLWISGLIVLSVVLHEHVEEVDKLMVMIAGIGIGNVTQFFTAAILLLVQFFARKSPPDNGVK